MLIPQEKLAIAEVIIYFKIFLKVFIYREFNFFLFFIEPLKKPYLKLDKAKILMIEKK